MRRVMLCIVSLMVLLFNGPIAKAAESDQNDIFTKRMELYQSVESLTNIPWYYLAAIDQYERNVRQSRKDLPKAEGITGIYIPPEKWVGLLNPDITDENPFSIQFFQGMGTDGDQDGIASLSNDFDVIYSMANYILNYGTNHDYVKLALWDYYNRDKTVGIILDKAKIYKHFGHLNLEKHAFPLPLRSNYSYKNTWGDARGWGGRRIHEGTDIFANYGVPVKATSYGIVEMKGWNKYGGWRVGIRDINNNYHYFAHLNGFAKDLHKGQIVEPGQIIGSVGASGYGPPGTSGKFPPHLHYGIYKDNGRTEWSFDPFPHLKLWERQERQQLHKK